MPDISTPVPKIEDPLGICHHLANFFRNKAFYQISSWINLTFRQCLQSNGSLWNWYETGTDKPCVHVGPSGSSIDQICYLVPNGSTYEGDTIWNHAVLVSNQSCVNRVDPYHGGSNPKQI